ncbi:Hsp20/alpha crystallin family protein [Haloarchaeobius baliensis]|uniref:Hsp20/alpha crystallin family protein n=1 Tax=Haloarchaeobius baliensis TaxID=1670458 RepID=UPI003F882062
MSWQPPYQPQQGQPYGPPQYGLAYAPSMQAQSGVDTSGMAAPAQQGTTVSGQQAAPQAATAAPQPGGQQFGGPGVEFGVPRADVVELAEVFRVELEMPGFEKDDISVYADENHLIVSAERTVEEGRDRRVLQRERPLRLERTVQLPVTVDVDETTAAYEDGVCVIDVPKGEGERHRRIGFQ